MPSDIKDVTREYGPDVQKPSPLVVCELKRVLSGTFCFPFGNGFGCGASSEVERGQEISLEAKLGAEGKGLSGEVTFGAKFTSSVKWSYTADKCEYCRPEICFPNSTLFIYECERFLSFWSWTTIDKIFEPGPQGEIRSNCTKNDPLCGCGKEQSSLPSAGGLYQENNSGSYARVVTPTHFARRPGFNDPSDAVSTADAIAAVLEDLAPANLDPIRRQALGFVDQTGSVNWVYPPAPAPAARVSLLTRRCADFLTGMGATQPSGPFLPVLAVMQCAPNARAEARLSWSAPDGSPRQILQNAEVRTGLVTSIWTEFNLSDEPLPPGATARLRLKITGPTGCVAGLVGDTFAVPQRPTGERT
jgi:hypothetical protein